MNGVAYLFYGREARPTDEGSSDVDSECRCSTYSVRHLEVARDRADEQKDVEPFVEPEQYSCACQLAVPEQPNLVPGRKGEVIQDENCRIDTHISQLIQRTIPM